MRRSVRATLISAASFIFVVSVLFSVRAHQAGRDDKMPERSEATTNTSGKKSEGVKLDRATQQRVGIDLDRLLPATGHAEVTVYGILEEDPSEVFTLRAPLAGVVVSQGNWPAVGAIVAEGARIGSVRPKLTAIDRLTLTERLGSTRAEADAARLSVTAAREEVNRLRQLNAENKNASDKALQESEARLGVEEAKLKTAQTAVQLIGAALQPESTAGAMPLEVRKGGQVLEVLVQPGESVESGQGLIRVGRFNRLLARLHVPPGQEIDSSVWRVMVMPAGLEDEIPAERVALGATVDPRYQGQTLIFRLSSGRAVLRPGQAVSARLAIPRSSARGVLIPSRAILRFQGQSWVYLQAEPDEFVRRKLTLDHPVSGGWLATSGFQSGQQVVVSGAQILLSEEMKSQLEPDED
jgi:biotin carboxyl carrier protein